MICGISTERRESLVCGICQHLSRFVKRTSFSSESGGVIRRAKGPGTEMATYCAEQFLRVELSAMRAASIKMVSSSGASDTAFV